MTASTENPSLYGSQQDYTTMFQMIFGGYVSQVVYTVARLSFAEHFARGVRTPEGIAEAESLDVQATFRLMRACVSSGLLRYDAKTGFSSTPLLDVLHADAPNSMRGVALIIPAQGHWLPWGRLEHAVRSGEPQAVAALGKSAWQHLADTPDEAAAFALTMKSVSQVFNGEAVKHIATGQSTLAVDIGGANGTLVHALMMANSDLQGRVFDLPHVVPTAIDAAREHGLEARFSVTGGDFLTDALPAGDLYLLKLILHDWDDQTCASLLANCRNSIRAKGRLIIVEQLLGDINEPGFNPLMDLDMLVMLGGKERTLPEYTTLLAAHGFKVTGVTPTASPFAIIEAVAV
ncbi:methyltransferase [Pseudomonas fluorescens]|nr:methyltransferase [Pseudomonas fluorescens]